MSCRARRALGVFLLLTLLMVLVACASKPSVTQGQAGVDYELLLTLPTEPISYEHTIRPILDRRCVVCHGCYDAPCQLKLSSIEGLQRGASEIKVYDGARVRPIEPTRLLVDAKSVPEWRGKGFHAVLNEGAARDAKSNLDNSVLYQMLRLKQRHPQPRVGMIADDVDVSLGRKQICTAIEDFEDFASKHPMWGMPYGMPNLKEDEYRQLVQWIAQGSPGSQPAVASTSAQKQIARWESFLNGTGYKQRLVSRYLYEHLLQAHIHFQSTPNREFYRLVRSHTPPGTEIDEIATVRPYDDPGTAFYYRLLRYHPSVVVKDHMIYEWSDKRMQRYRELFIDPSYEVASLPGYAEPATSNPFKVYEAIPPIARYRFLLDDAHFFIEGFIKGPVCRGQIALNVIEDQFWVFFMKPRAEALTLQTEFLEASADYLNLPAERGDDSLRILTTWRDYLARQKRYLAAKGAFLQERFDNPNAALDLEDAVALVWNGEGDNPNAALTVFRHFDSASVSFGLVGDYPETAWVIDYPLLERIHYLLVAGFNVYGNVTHQLTTRLYMDFLRMEAEHQFLLFMPVEQRRQIIDSWYVGMQKRVEKEFKEAQEVVVSLDTVGGYTSADPKREFLDALQAHLGKAAGAADIINRCTATDCDAPAEGSPGQIDRAMRRMTTVRGELLSVFPDVAFVRVRNGADGGADLAYTVILNKGYTNITSMFEDEDRRDRSQDTLTVVRGLLGSYPNFFFEVDSRDIEAFVTRFEAITNREDYERFVGLYGVRRTNVAFWPAADWFHDTAAVQDPLRAGIFDLNRYQNR